MSDWSPSQHELDRRRVRSRLRTRSAAIATAMTVGVFVAIGFAVTQSPGWETVKENFLSWPDAKASFPDIRDAIWLNIKMFLIAEAFILVIAMLIAMARVSRSPWLMPLRVTAVVYTDVVRGIPTILLVYLFAFGMPALQLQGLSNSPFFWATAALIVSYSAYVAEVFRSGIESVHPSQWSSAQALGLSRGQALRHVIVPQAVRRVVPPLLNDFVSLQKDTALASAAGVFEAVATARDYTLYNFNFTPYLVVAGFFIAMTVPLARLCDWLTARMRRRELAGAL
ncbi:amino acid ABC transporter permease [Nocardioides sp. YIM 152315]|uniref:amino acid ABC transporter permease n=1 Tax=Nocardioides sp. YIM 152315 TaxID=3031760 RepID=UPI0023DBC4BA|nr:amino acid ABC transporter permease [Nocardioides sp. YIM 152315]MDF1604351.1 amino acid ABC transporter permease [Nocardioides sp. YIM 152315]